jgi:hypothetical protein
LLLWLLPLLHSLLTKLLLLLQKHTKKLKKNIKRKKKPLKTLQKTQLLLLLLTKRSLGFAKNEGRWLCQRPFSLRENLAIGKKYH